MTEQVNKIEWDEFQEFKKKKTEQKPIIEKKEAETLDIEFTNEPEPREQETEQEIVRFKCGKCGTINEKGVEKCVRCSEEFEWNS